jgi:hypothetical protein
MTNFNYKKFITENKLTQTTKLRSGMLTEGQFSWMTQDTGQQIGSEDENTILVYMFDDKGNFYYENNYEGYGDFGGMDYYSLLDKMNGGRGDRGRGIDLAFGNEKTASRVLFPALVAKPDMFNYKTHDFTKEPESDPNQSWYAPEEDDFYDQNDEEVFGDMDKEEDYDYSDEEELEEVKTTNTKMKKSELKAKIKEMIVAETNSEKVEEVDFLAELEGMLDEASEFDTNKPARIAAFIKDLDALIDEYHAELYLFGGVLDAIEMVKKVAQEEIDMLKEAKGDEEVDADVEAADDTTGEDTTAGEEAIDTTVDVSTTEVNPDVKSVQDALTQAQAAAQKLGDPKLTDQIGNTITFFTRSHVVEKPNSIAEGDEMEEAMIPIEPGDSDYDIGYKTFFVYEDRIGGFDIENIKKAGMILANKIKNDNKIKNTDEFFRGFMDSWNESSDSTADKEDMYESKKPVNEVMFPMLKRILK